MPQIYDLVEQDQLRFTLDLEDGRALLLMVKPTKCRRSGVTVELNWSFAIPQPDEVILLAPVTSGVTNPEVDRS